MSIADRPILASIRVFAALVLAVAPMGAHSAKRSVEQKLAAQPRSSVEISNVAGRVEVLGWDRAEIAVTGTLGENVERLEFKSAAGRAEIRVILPKTTNDLYIGDSRADLVIRVPSDSSVLATVVSAALIVKGVSGAQKLRSMSGDVQVGGGSIGEMDVSTMSGAITLQVGPVARARFKSVSGKVAIDASLAAHARVDVETLTGDVHIGLVGEPSGEFSIETLSGKIDSCFGARSTGPVYGLGSRLAFREASGTGTVRIATTSGDVRLCRS
jgi:Putative adhesin